MDGRDVLDQKERAKAAAELALAEAEATTFVGANVPADLVTALDRIADAAERTRSAEIRVAIRRHVEAQASGAAA